MTRTSDAAGDLAVDLVQRVAEPLRILRDRLGLVVDHIERHIASSSGPVAYPWRSLTSLRQDLAAAYLDATTLARKIDELDRAVGELAAPLQAVDVVSAVELGLRLCGHHLGTDLDQVIDLGRTPPIRGSSGTLALLVAQLVVACATSARTLPGSALSVRTGLDGDEVFILVTDNGAGSERAGDLGALAQGLLTPWGGAAAATSAPGGGTAFELRFSTAIVP